MLISSLNSLTVFPCHSAMLFLGMLSPCESQNSQQFPCVNLFVCLTVQGFGAADVEAAPKKTNERHMYCRMMRRTMRVHQPPQYQLQQRVPLQVKVVPSSLSCRLMRRQMRRSADRTENNQSESIKYYLSNLLSSTDFRTFIAERFFTNCQRTRILLRNFIFNVFTEFLELLDQKDFFLCLFINLKIFAGVHFSVHNHH